MRAQSQPAKPASRASPRLCLTPLMTSMLSRRDVDTSIQGSCWLWEPPGSLQSNRPWMLGSSTLSNQNCILCVDNSERKGHFYLPGITCFVTGFTCPQENMEQNTLDSSTVRDTHSGFCFGFYFLVFHCYFVVFVLYCVVL